jgi:hypothetical protein
MKHIYIIIVLWLFALVGFAQQPTDVTPLAATDGDTLSAISSPNYIANRKGYLSKLNSTLFSTGILIDRSAFRTDIHQFNGDDRVKTCSFFIWEKLYGNLTQSCNDTLMMPNYNAFKQYLIGMGHYQNTYIIPILNMQFNTIDKQAYQRGDFTETDSFLVSSGATKASFLTTRLLAATPFAGRIHGNEATFMIDSNIYVSNIPIEKLQTVEADFDDGLGWQSLQWNTPVMVSYGATSRWVMAKLRFTLKQLTFTTDSLGRMFLKSDSSIQRFSHFSFLHTGTDLVPEPAVITQNSDTTSSILKSDILDNEPGFPGGNPPESNILPFGYYYPIGNYTSNLTVSRDRTANWITYGPDIMYTYSFSRGVFQSTTFEPGLKIISQYSIAHSHSYSWRETNGKAFDYNIVWGVGNNSGKLRKPMIVVDGFDPGNTRDYYQTILKNPTGDNKSDDYRGIYELMNGEKSAWSKDPGAHLCEDLTNAGYDLLFINWTTGDADIPTNAEYLREFLKNQSIGPNSSALRDNQTEEIIMVGPSMGGLITRWCLATMEQNNEEHHVKLWFSFDSPQQGANIPIALQLSVMGLNSELNYLDKGLTATSDVKAGLATTQEGIAELSSPAALQMLLYHYSSMGSTTAEMYNHNDGSSLCNPIGSNFAKTFFYNRLNLLGYPRFSKNIAISNGGIKKLYDNQSQDFQFSSSGFEAWAAGAKFNLAAYGNVQNTPESCVKIYEGRWYVDKIGDFQLWGSDLIGVDNAPGSYNTTLYDFNQNDGNSNKPSTDLSTNASYSQATFMVTASAFGIPVTRDNVYKTHDQYVAKDTPFDDIYGTSRYIQGVSDGSNEEHVRVSDLTSKWLKNYLEKERQAIQKPYRSDVIEAESNKCLYTAVNSITMGGQANSTFTVKSGADIQAIAPHIIMQPGFKVEQGAHFVAKPQSVVNGLKDYIEKPDPVQSKNVVTYLTLSKYNNKVYDYAGNEITRQNVSMSVSNHTVYLYPNPATNTVFVTCTDSNVISLSLSIVNMLGVTVKTATIANRQNIDIAALPQGLYFVQIMYYNKQNCFKLIKD